jgi:hypothetical protein
LPEITATESASRTSACAAFHGSPQFLDGHPLPS